MGLDLSLSVAVPSMGAALLPPWQEVKNKLDSASPSVYADFGRDKYALANVGPNLLTGNGLQSGLGSWTAVSGTVTASGGVMRVAGDGSGGRAQYTMTGLTVGKVYVLTFNFQAFNGTNIVYAVSSNASSTPTNADMVGSSSSTGAKQLLFVANGTTRNILVAIGNTAVGNWADVSDFVVREITSSLGPNLVRNGNFDTDLTGWTDASTAPATVTQSGGQVVVSSDGTNGARLRQSIVTVIGRTYVVSCTGTAPLAVGTTSGGSEILAFVGGRPRVFVATATTTWVNMLSTVNGQTLDDVSVREVLVGLGPELVANSGFDTDLSGWTDASAAGASFSWQSGRAVAVTDGVAVARLRAFVATVVGRTYQVSVGGTGGMLIGTVVGQSDIMSVGGNLEKTFVATTTTTYVSYSNINNGIYLDFVSVREVLTNQPLQPVTLNEMLSASSGAKTVVANDNTLKVSPANYPAFDYSTGKRRLLLEGATTNLVAYSQPDANWTRVGVPAFSTQATFGLLNLVGLSDTANAGQFYTSSPVATFVSGTTYVLSAHVKDDTAGKAQVVANSTSFGSNVWATFNLTTGAVTESGAAVLATYATALGGGIWRFELVGTCTASGSTTGCAVVLVGGATGRIPNYTGTGTRCLIGAVQVEAGVRASSYISTAGSSVTRVNDICLFSPLLNLCIPQMAATMAYRANIKAAIASQSIIGLTGWPLIRAGIGTPASLVLDASSTAAYALGNVIPGEVGAAFGWDSGGRNGSVNGAATLQNPVAPDKPMPPFAFGPTSGLTAGSFYAIGAFVVWPLKASNSNLQQQARAYA